MNIRTNRTSPTIYTKEIYKGAAHTKFCPLAGELKVLDADKFTLTAPVSTISNDRDGEVVLPNAADISLFMKNPMFLWNHEWFGGPEKAIGFVKNLRPTERAMVATLRYHAEEEFAGIVWRKVLAKVIRGFSIGFRMIEWVTARDSEEAINALPKDVARALRRGDIHLVHTKIELLEVSQVLIPANGDSLADVDEEMAAALLSLEPQQSSSKQTERTDEMDLNQLQSDMASIKSSLANSSDNQSKIASALSSVAEAIKANGEVVAGLKAATQAKPAEAAPSAIKSVDDVPDHIVEQIVKQTMEALTSG